jgi:translocator protein
VPFDVPDVGPVATSCAESCRVSADDASAVVLGHAGSGRLEGGDRLLVGITLLATASTRAADDRTYYMALRRPPWAPPPWAFGVAWPILNLLQVWSDLELVNKAPSSRRSRLLWLRALNWFCFVIYTPAFFRLRSPAAGSAVAMAQAAIAYATIAETGGGSGRQRWSIVPLAAWTSYAAALSESVRRPTQRRRSSCRAWPRVGSPTRTGLRRPGSGRPPSIAKHNRHKSRLLWLRLSAD